MRKKEGLSTTTLDSRAPIEYISSVSSPLLIFYFLPFRLHLFIPSVSGQTDSREEEGRSAAIKEDKAGITPACTRLIAASVLMT